MKVYYSVHRETTLCTGKPLGQIVPRQPHFGPDSATDIFLFFYLASLLSSPDSSRMFSAPTPLIASHSGLALPFAVSEELRARRCAPNMSFAPVPAVHRPPNPSCACPPLLPRQSARTGRLPDLPAMPRRDDWRKAVLKFDPALQDATPGVRIFVTREVRSCLSRGKLVVKWRENLLFSIKYKMQHVVLIYGTYVHKHISCIPLNAPPPLDRLNTKGREGTIWAVEGVEMRNGWDSGTAPSQGERFWQLLFKPSATI